MVSHYVALLHLSVDPEACQLQVVREQHISNDRREHIAFPGSLVLLHGAFLLDRQGRQSFCCPWFTDLATHYTGGHQSWLVAR